jgi:hypothetical protein
VKLSRLVAIDERMIAAAINAMMIAKNIARRFTECGAG